MVDNKEKFSDLLENSLNVDMRQGAIVKGKVISIDDKFVIVNAGLKSEGVIDVREFCDEQGKLTISVGDEVDLSLLALENGLGETCLSRQHAQRAVIWNEIEAAKENDTVIEGVILGRVKGGLTVGVSGIKAFLPGSLIDIRPVRDLDILPEGEIIQCKVVKMDQKRNNVVVSRRAVLEAESGGDRDELLSSLEEGMELPGVVKNLTDYGAFVDLGGIDGLLHITDMSWKRIKHPSDMVTVGQDITVKVLSYDKEKTRVSLGIKQLTGDPWNNIATRYNDGDRIFGAVTNIADYGCFVEIEEGIEGLVHMSEMDWTNKNIHPSKIVSLGDKVEVMVLEIDESRRRISLGLKQCIQNPWAEFSSQHQINDVIEGTIKSITDFGMFVGLDGGIDGLVHLTDVSWSESGESAIREYKKGEVIKVVVLSIDSERERISLGIKQLTEDPYQLYLSQHPKGSQVTGSVASHDAKKVVLSLADGVSGILRRSDFADDENFESEQAITAYISYDERRSNGLLLSLTETTPVATDDEPNNHKPEQKKKAAKPVTATIGDIMKGKLDDVKKTARTKKKDAEE